MHLYFTFVLIKCDRRIVASHKFVSLCLAKAQFCGTFCVVLLRFQKFRRQSVSVGFARKTAVFCSVSVFVCPVFPLSSMWYVYAAHCTSNLQQYVTYFCV